MNICDGGYTSGQLNCPEHYEWEPVKNNIQSTVTYSIIMHLEHQFCNMGCKYCICDTAPAGFDTYKKYGKNYKKMISLIMETDNKRNTSSFKHHFEIWGGEPLYNGKAFKEVVETLRKHFPNCDFSTSTNGILLGNDKIRDYLIENNIRFQLSHDGLGEKYRANGTDPLENEHTNENIKILAQKGLLANINCTLSQSNPSFFENIKFWNKKRKEWGIWNNKSFQVKLNHPYNSDYEIKDFAFTDKEIMHKHFGEFIALYSMYVSGNNSLELLPYKPYIFQQVRDNYKVGKSASCCSAFQDYKYNNKGNQSWSFAITTEGKYSECILAEEVENPGGHQPDYCKGCEYENYSGCKSCGSLNYPKKCIYQKTAMDSYKICEETRKWVELSQQRKTTAKKIEMPLLERFIKNMKQTKQPLTKA